MLNTFKSIFPYLAGSNTTTEYTFKLKPPFRALLRRVQNPFQTSSPASCSIRFPTQFESHKSFRISKNEFKMRTLKVVIIISKWFHRSVRTCVFFFSYWVLNIDLLASYFPSTLNMISYTAHCFRFWTPTLFPRIPQEIHVWESLYISIPDRFSIPLQILTPRLRPLPEKYT